MARRLSLVAVALVVLMLATGGAMATTDVPGDGAGSSESLTALEKSYWIPIAINAGGLLSSQWRSDLGLLCAGTDPASVTLKLHRSGAPALSVDVTVAAGQQLILRDVVGTTFGVTGKGPVEIRSDQPLVVTSRTYNDSATGTFGQDYDGFAAGSGLSAGQSAWIGQLTQKPPYRTNIGLTNTGSTQAVVGVTLFDNSGTELKTFDVTLTPGLFWQQEAFKQQTGRDDLDACYAKITARSGTGVLAHGSVIDARTNDPTTLWAKTPDTQVFPAAGGASSILVYSDPGQAWWASTTAPWVRLEKAEGVGNGSVELMIEENHGEARSATIVVDGRSYTVAQGAGGLWAEPYSYWLPVTVNSPGNLGSLWRSDAGLLSNGTSAASVELKFFPKGGTPTTTSVAVGAREQVILRDVIGQALGITPGKGPLKITSDQPLIVTSRTYNDSATGTLGQDYDGFSGDSGLSAGQSALIAQLTHKEPYRTNLGLTNMGSTPAVVRVTLYDGEGVQLAAFSVNLQPGSFWQEEVFKNNTTRKDLDACYAKVTVQSGSGILAHGSVIDGRTNDPTTLWGKLQCLKPTIATQPKDQGVKEGATATLSIAATGTAPLSYQWYQGSSGETTTPIAGATSSSLTTAAFTETGSFKYWARVSNDCGSADSATATVTVTPGCSATCTATVPTAAIRGKVVTFTGAATPANCDEPATVTWEWSFGDGSAVSTLQSPTYQYATPGSYNWTLKVSVGGVVKCSKSGTISIAEDYSGTWNGLTIQGWNISFTITDNVVTNVDFRVDGTSCWTSIKGRIPTNVIANKFKVIIYSWGIIEGFFDSATQAHGTVSSIYNSQCMVQPINWTAKKS